MKIRGVIFDVDGVLVDSEPFLAEAAARMFREKGAAVNPEDFRVYVGTGEDHFLGGVAQTHGVPLVMPDDKIRVYQIYLEMIRGRMGAMPGVLDFVARCRKQGLLLAAASSADHMKVVGNLEEAGLTRDQFDAIVTGSDVARKKPAPDIFLEACRQLGLEPETCLVVEDAVAGVTAARTAHCKCLALTSTFRAEELREADWISATLADAPPDVLEW